MSSSLSILTASPNKKMYCARFANCHMFRILCSMLGSGAGSSASISSLARFLDPMAAMERAAEVTREVVRERAKRGRRRGVWTVGVFCGVPKKCVIELRSGGAGGRGE